MKVSPHGCHGCGAPLLVSHPPRKWCSERCRKRQYDGTCERCGGRFSGTDPGKRVSLLCQGCQREAQHEQAVERCISEVHRWAGLYGEPPSAADWQPKRVRWAQRAYDEGRIVGRSRAETTIALIEERHRITGPWPDADSAQRLFGGWNALIVAAGFPPVPRGGRRYLIEAA